MIEYSGRTVSYQKKKEKYYPLLSLPTVFRKWIGKKYKITVINDNKIIIELENEKI
jgi:hypothetical protein